MPRKPSNRSPSHQRTSSAACPERLRSEFHSSFSRPPSAATTRRSRSAMASRATADSPVLSSTTTSPHHEGQADYSRAMRITVLGAGSWGTTVASVLTRRDHESLIWARSPATADEINAKHSNERYLEGFALPARLRATADLAEAAAHAELLVVGVPTGAFRETLERVRPDLHPWIPVVSLSKGLERDSLLR